MQSNRQRVDYQRYTIIPRTLSFIFRGDSVLLIQYGPSKGAWAGKYNGIGGHIHQGESVYAAAMREVREETGIKSEALVSSLCGTVLINTGETPGIGLYVFAAEMSDPAGQMPGTSDEGTTCWVPLAEISGLDAMEDLPVLLEKVQQVRGTTRPPFAALYSYDEEGRLQMIFDPPAV